MGRLSNKEKELIYADFAAGLTEETICAKFKRPLSTIQDAIKDISSINEKKKTKTIIIDSVGELKSKHFWKELQSQLMNNEIEYFIESWGKLVKQFSQYDILETDEMIMKDLIVHDILINRNLIQKKSLMEEIEFFQQELDDEIKKSERDQIKIQHCHTKLSNARSSLSDLERTHDTIQKRKDQKFRDMKATRDLRYKQIEDAKKTWFELIKELDAYNMRTKEGEWLALMKKSVKNEEERLSEFHEYADGEFDQILLTPETVKSKE
jgi:hypothetical protein